MRQLFRTLPVRAADMQHNARYGAKLVKAIQRHCTNLSLIWPTLTLELAFQGTDSPERLSKQDRVVEKKEVAHLCCH